MKPKLNSTVSVVKINDSIIEFFLSNTRRQIRIKVESDIILDIVLSLDGKKSVEEIANEFGVEIEELNLLFGFLRSKGILDNVEPKSDFLYYEKYRRIIHFLAEYSSSHAHLLKMWNKIQQSTVVIIGLGAVGTWVTMNLAQSGVSTIVLIDNDVVESSNIHRQFGFTENDIGEKKCDVLEKRINALCNDTKIIKEYSFIDETSLHCLDDFDISLIINCADKPSVDRTSLWVGEYAMSRGIPHIVGGGYNLHLSLIGQTVIPGKTACVKCFQRTLEEENTIDSTKVKKLNIKNRKIGSFGPMCSLISSMVGMEAIKVLSGEIPPSNADRRGEFNIYDMDIKYKNYNRRNDCEWCGKNGKYYRL